jgi:hypothetical protein
MRSRSPHLLPASRLLARVDRNEFFAGVNSVALLAC